MKVLDLLCPLDHAFEGWFGSEQDFLDQQQRQLVQCPMCGSSEVRKALSAPRLNLRTGREPAAPAREAAAVQESQEPSAGADRPPQALQALWLQFARQVVANTEDVGGRFATEARRMHHGEIPERAIRGQASSQEASALLEEGIAVLPLLLPEAAKNTLQ